MLLFSLYWYNTKSQQITAVPSRWFILYGKDPTMNHCSVIRHGVRIDLDCHSNKDTKTKEKKHGKVYSLRRNVILDKHLTQAIADEGPHVWPVMQITTAATQQKGSENHFFFFSFFEWWKVNHYLLVNTVSYSCTHN